MPRNKKKPKLKLIYRINLFCCLSISLYRIVNCVLRTSDVQTRFRVVLVLYGHYTTRCVQIARRCNVTHGRAAGDFVSTNTSTIRVESVCVWTEHSLTVTLSKVIYLYITLFSLVSKHSYLFFNEYSFIFRFFWSTFFVKYPFGNRRKPSTYFIGCPSRNWRTPSQRFWYIWRL